MTKNIKSIFFVLTLVTLLATVGAVCAADDANSTITTDTSVSDATTVTDTTSDTVAAEPVQTASNDIKIDTKTIEKEEKNIKKEPITIDDVTYTKTYENLDLNEEYYVNSMFGGKTLLFSENTFINNCTISGNGGMYGYFGNEEDPINVFINNTVITIPSMSSYGNYILNNSTIPQTSHTGNLTIYNSNITKHMQIYNPGNLSIYNSTLNSTIENRACIIIDDNSIIADGFSLEGQGSVIINDTEKILPYLSTLNGTYLLENMTISSNKMNYGNLTIDNCTITKTVTNYENMTINNSVVHNGYVNNYDNGTLLITNSILRGSGNIYNAIGVMSIQNSTLNLQTSNYGTLIIGDDVTFLTNFKLSNGGIIVINDSNRIYPYLTTFTGNNTLNNLSIDKSITNNGEMSIGDSIINKRLTNNGNLTLSNTTINTTINNQGTLTITDDCIIGENCQITGNGQIIINDTNKIAPYLQTFNGNYTLENTTINTTKTNNQNLTIKNSNITAQITNNGNLTLSNTTINSTINNQGTLTITDDCIIGDNLIIGGEGEIIINDTNKIAPYLQTFNGNYTLENMTIDSIKINYGNLTIINSTINAYIGNGGNLIITNSTINAYMENYGTLIISDDTIIGDEFYLDNYGQLIMNDTTRVGIYSGNIIKDNTVINSSITIPNDGNVTFINSNITAPITNNGNLTFINSTIWAPITNRGNLIIDNSPVTNTTLKNYGNITVLNTTLNQTNISNSNTAELKIYNSTIYDSITGNPGGKTVEIYNTNFIGNAFAGTLTVNCSYMNGSTVTARGDVINCSFINNSRVDNRYYASNGGALTGTNLTVTNCIFINNGLYMNNDTGVSGGSGGAIAGTNLTVINCTFDSNYAQTKSSWIQCQGGGAISADGNINITNSTFKNNYVISPHGTIINGSTYFTVFETGMGGAILATGIATITNNQFINNSASINGSAIYLTGGTNKLHTITNNRFQDNNQAVETIYIRNYFEDIENKKLIYFDTPTNITDNNYSNNSIGFKTLTLNGPNKAYMGDQITITLDIELEHPEFYDEDILEQTQYTWYINGETNTNKETEKTITVGNENIITYVKPTISNTRTKVLAITPTILNDIIITPDNINNYVFEGELIVSANSRLIFQGEFNNIGEIYNNKNEVIFDGTNATFTNTAFIIEAQNNTLQNMNINNTDTSDYIITIIGSDNTIQNNTLNQYNSNDKTAAIYNNNGNNNKITQNTIKVSGPALAITYEAGATTANTQGILSVGGQNNTITYNMITVTNSTDSDQSQFGTIEAITAPQGTNNNISYNTIQCTGARFNYGINTLENVQGNSITYNNITVTGYRYTDGIQVGDGATGNLIANNNINLTCLNTTPVDEAAISYGVIITSQGGQISDNNTITQNNITINGAVNYGMEIYTSTNTFITENNISLTGVKSMGIGYAHSPNSIVTDNNITINDDSTGTLNSVTEEIQPLSTGIRIQQDSSNILIEHNTIITNDSQKQDTTINSEDNNITIKNNQLTSSQGYGDETINAPLTANKENNIIETTTTLAVPESIATNTAITLTATVTTADGTPINGGTVTFTKGNEAIAQTTVTDGIATATITFTQEEEDVTIVASYTPTSTGLSTSSAEAATSIQAPITQLNIAEIDMTAGETVTLTARVTDQNGNNINGGKVTFKVNGKTVKDASGKVIYAKVVDGVATAQYTVPDSLAGKDVNITASYSGSAKYNKESTTITKTVAAQEPTLTITPITDDVQTGSTITLKAKIAAGDKAITNGKIVFKINGKTVKDANGKVIYAHVDANGEVSIDYNLGNLKTGTYTIEATFIAPNYDKITSNTTMTVVKA